MTKDYTYKGYQIQPCQAAEPGTHGGRWVVRVVEHGLLRFEDQSAHYQTLAAAKEAITEQDQIRRGLALLDRASRL